MPFVCRVRETPPTEIVVCAEATVVPVCEEFSVMVQLPVPPAVVHGFGVVNAPGPPLSIVKLICVPSGAFWNEPLPLFTLTCAVNVCARPTRFVAAGGVIWMFASTNVL